VPARNLLAAAAAVAWGIVASTAAQTPSVTIWDGVFSEAQASRGQRAYGESCGSCHAEDLLGTSNAPPLVGEPFLGRFNRSTLDDVVQTIARTMPQEAPNSLATTAYVDIVSYLLKANGSPAGAAELPAERQKLQQVLVTTKEAR
jgi:mono/diheme cytochrome c family protein